jgi:predicted RNase H-like HicB family nuclease
VHPDVAPVVHLPVPLLALVERLQLLPGEVRFQPAPGLLAELQIWRSRRTLRGCDVMGGSEPHKLPTPGAPPGGGPEKSARLGPMYQITLEIRKLEEGPYLGTSPELPGLIVQAASPEEVVALAPEVARDLIEVMAETGEPLPPSLRLETESLRVSILVPA